MFFLSYDCNAVSVSKWTPMTTTTLTQTFDPLIIPFYLGKVHAGRDDGSYTTADRFNNHISKRYLIILIYFLYLYVPVKH